MVPISGSAHLQGRQWVDMSGWSEGSEEKGEVGLRCGWVKLGGDHREVVIPFHMQPHHNTCRLQMSPTHPPTPHTYK